MKKLLIVAIIALAWGCQRPQPTASPVDVFETLWSDFNEHYSGFTPRAIDWNELYSIYRPKVSENISEDSLWSVVCSMLSHTDDAHVWLSNPGRRYYQADSHTPGNDYWELMVELTIQPTRMVAINNYLKYAEVDGRSIIYLYVGGFHASNYPIEDVDRLMSMAEGYDAVIVDVRDNRGGHESYGLRLASYFASAPSLAYYTQKKNGAGWDDFKEPVGHYSTFHPDNFSSKPLVVLTNSHSTSMAERFVLAVREFENVAHIGETTNGSFSAPSQTRFLSGGWRYGYSVERVILPDGTCPEGVGCMPDIEAANDWSSQQPHTDMVVQAALDYLRTTYGI